MKLNNILLNRNKLFEVLSFYSEIVENEDKSVTYNTITTDYFLKNNEWHIDFFKRISQFKKDLLDWENSHKNIIFRFHNSNINLEMKSVVFSKIFRQEWSVRNVIMNLSKFQMRNLSFFLREKYPHLNSILELNISKANLQWIDWLEKSGIQTKRSSEWAIQRTGKCLPSKTTIACFLKNVYDYLFNLLDDREEWVKDKWHIRNLEYTGLKIVKSSSHHYLDFSKITNENLRTMVKEYIKKRLLSKNDLRWSSARSLIMSVTKFLNFITLIEPTWNNLSRLDRTHVEKYIEWLNIYCSNINFKNKNPESHINKNLSNVTRFLDDIQLFEYVTAPKKEVRKLMFPSDKPKLKKKPYGLIEFVPDFVLEQLFRYFSQLHPEVQPVVLIMFETGLRISDVLSLRQSCLLKINGKFYLQMDIQKTDVKDHRIPITDRLADMVAVLIHRSLSNTNDDNNPDKLIFVRTKGSRKGLSYTSAWIQDRLIILAKEKNIVDENGKLYHFKNHPFRHTYAIKLLNNGVDFLTVQELMAHASPEMTVKYAKLLDETKRTEFEKAVNNGAFSFNSDGKIEFESEVEKIEDLLKMLWLDHKLNAVDTPYGTCLQRIKGKCSLALQPACITANCGKPCKDILIQPSDTAKYRLLMDFTQGLIRLGEKNNKKETVDANQRLYGLYLEIYKVISNGSFIFGNKERLLTGGVVNA